MQSLHLVLFVAHLSPLCGLTSSHHPMREFPRGEAAPGVGEAAWVLLADGGQQAAVPVCCALQESTVRALREQVNGLAAESQKRQQGIDALKMKIVLVRPPASCDRRFAGSLALSAAAHTVAAHAGAVQHGPDSLSAGVVMLMLPRVLCCPCCSTLLLHQAKKKLDELGPIPDHTAEINQITQQQNELRDQVRAVARFRCLKHLPPTVSARGWPCADSQPAAFKGV